MAHQNKTALPLLPDSAHDLGSTQKKTMFNSEIVFLVYIFPINILFIRSYVLFRMNCEFTLNCSLIYHFIIFRIFYFFKIKKVFFSVFFHFISFCLFVNKSQAVVSFPCFFFNFSSFLSTYQLINWFSFVSLFFFFFFK